MPLETAEIYVVIYFSTKGQCNSVKEKIVFSTNEAGKLHIDMGKYDAYFTSCTQLSSKCMMGLNVKAKTTKILKRAPGRKLFAMLGFAKLH